MTAIGVVGLGLIGGSIALAAELAGHQVVGWDADPETRAQAAASGLTVSSELSSVDLVLLAVPLSILTDGLPETLAAVSLPGTATITDVGSLKQPVAAAISAAGLSARYIGGHPMAGTEHSGFDAASPDLFSGAAWALCLDGNETDLGRWLAAAALITSLGAEIVPITAAEHDNAMALVSGIPHLLALALSVSAQLSGPLVGTLAAGSFADLTRVAASSPTLLHAVTEQNAPAVRAALRLVTEQLERPWVELIADGRIARAQLSGETTTQRAAGTAADGMTEVSGIATQDLLDLGRSGVRIQSVDPATATIRYRQPGAR